MIDLIVSDPCFLIDLEEVGLLVVMLELPYRFIIPLPLRYSEMLDLTIQDWRRLDAGGLETFDLSPEQVLKAKRMGQENPDISASDCFCLVTVGHHNDGVLLTRENRLCRAANAASVRVHGALWIIDQLETFAVCSARRLIAALESWRGDPQVFLPREEIEERLRRLRCTLTAELDKNMAVYRV